MNNKIIQFANQELEKRNIIKNKIYNIIKQNYVIDPTAKINKLPVQILIHRMLGNDDLPNGFEQSMYNTLLDECGFKSIRNLGRHYYRGFKSKI
jgi:hypothetical protein